MLGMCRSMFYFIICPTKSLSYLSMAQGDLIERPCHKKNIITPVSGSLGMPMICDILYRSKREYELKSMVRLANDQAEALQSLGCIRRTPSPEAVSAHGTRSTEIEVVPKTEASNVQVLKRENVALRVRNKMYLHMKHS